MFSVRMEQLHSKRPTLNVQRLIQKVDRPRTLVGDAARLRLRRHD